jgi:hypothetical protein
MTGVRPMMEKYALVHATQAYARMMSGKAEFRVALIDKTRRSHYRRAALDDYVAV